MSVLVLACLFTLVPERIEVTLVSQEEQNGLLAIESGRLSALVPVRGRDLFVQRGSNAERLTNHVSHKDLGGGIHSPMVSPSKKWVLFRANQKRTKLSRADQGSAWIVALQGRPTVSRLATQGTVIRCAWSGLDQLAVECRFKGQRLVQVFSPTSPSRPATHRLPEATRFWFWADGRKPDLRYAVGSKPIVVRDLSGQTHARWDLPAGQLTTHPAPSPDGKSLALLMRNGLWICSGNKVISPARGPFGEAVPAGVAWSPDSNKLAVVSGGSHPEDPIHASYSLAVYLPKGKTWLHPYVYQFPAGTVVTTKFLGWAGVDQVAGMGDGGGEHPTEMAYFDLHGKKTFAIPLPPTVLDLVLAIGVQP